jgi:tape measure domain-containing protein
MPDYDLVISVRGKNEAGAVFDQLERSLRRIGETALGVIAARTIESIAESITGVAVAAINASSAFQLMQLNLAALTAREMVKLSGDTKDVATIFGEAELKAKGLMNQLARMSILSPYMLNEVANTFRLNMAFGYTTDQAMKMTNGLLMMAAGIGADNEMLKRMAYNLAQVRQQGKVTALDVRQLALAGLDLEDVLKWTSAQMGYNIKDHLEFNKLIKAGKITWEDFATNFEKYADKYFRGATERMARTMIGLKNTMLDVFNLTAPKLFLGALDEVTKVFNQVLDLFMFLYDSGILDEIGAKITAWATVKLGPILSFMTDFIQNMKDMTAYQEETGVSFSWIQALNDAIEKNFGSDVLAKVLRIEDAFQTLQLTLELFSKGKWQDALKMAGVNWGWVDSLSGFVDKLRVAWSNLKIFWDANGDGIVQSFKDIGSALWEAIGGPGAGTEAQDTLNGIGQGFIDATQWLIDNGDEIESTIRDFADLLIEKLPLVRQQILDFGDAIEKKLPAVKDFFGGVFKEVADNPEKYGNIALILGSIAASALLLGKIDLTGPAHFFSILASTAVIVSSSGFATLMGPIATGIAGIATSAAAAAGPIAIVAVVLGSIALALWAIWTYKDQINEFFATLAARIAEQATSAGWGPFVEFLKEAWTYINNILTVVQLLASVWWELFKIGAQQVGKAISEMLPILKDNVYENFKEAWKTIAGIFSTLGYKDSPLQALINMLSTGLTKALEGINGWLDKLITKLERFLELLRGAKVGDDIIGNSPSPFENSLMGIAGALDIVNTKMMGLNTGLDVDSRGGNYTGGDSRIYNITINGGGSLNENDIIRALQKAGVSQI